MGGGVGRERKVKGKIISFILYFILKVKQREGEKKFSKPILPPFIILELCCDFIRNNGFTRSREVSKGRWFAKKKETHKLYPRSAPVHSQKSEY